MKKIILFILILCSSSQAMTVQTCIDEVRRLIQDTNAEKVIKKYSDNVLRNRINIAQVDLAAKSGCLEGREFITISATNTTSITMSTDALSSKRVYFQLTNASTSTFKLLEKLTIDQIDIDTLDYESKPAGYPIKWFRRKNEINLIPKIAGNYNNFKVRHDYIKKPTEVTANTDNLLDGLSYLEQYCNCIIWYVVAACKADTSGNITEEAYYKKYLEDIKFFSDMK